MRAVSSQSLGPPLAATLVKVTWQSPATYDTNPPSFPASDSQLAAKRPLSPDVFEINSISPHYKFPPGALSSITNRVTGVMLSTYAGAAGALALTGHLPLVLDFVTSSPLLLYPAKAAVAFPLVYHYLGGLRHLYWDEARHGRQVDDISPLKVPKVTTSSNTILGLSAVASALLTLVSF